jgi:protein-S-isoprenylcysteine O-methyltransferase Ste14
MAMSAMTKAVEGCPGRVRVSDRVLDVFERILVICLSGWLAIRIFAGYQANGQVVNLLLLPSEGLIVVFVLLRRRARSITHRLDFWALALAASCAPLLVNPGSVQPLVPPIVAAVLLLMGLLAQWHAKIILGRSFGCVPAHRGLRTGGPYQFVRHPIYAGYLLTHVAFLLLNPTLWNLCVYGITYSLQIPRLLTEEQLLSQDPEYRAYQAVVRYRLVPGLF